MGLIASYHRIRMIFAVLMVMALAGAKVYLRHERNEERRAGRVAPRTASDYQDLSQQFARRGVNISAEALQASKDENLPEFGDAGGTITLDLMGKPVTLPIQPSEIVACAQNGHKVFGLLLHNKQTEFAVSQPKSFTRINGVPDFSALEHQTFSVLIEDPKPHVVLPGLGDYAVTSGTMTIDDVRFGKQGNSLWTGKLALALHTARGAIPVQGQFQSVVQPIEAENEDEE